MSEDRKTQGLYLRFDITKNFVANHLKDFCGPGNFLSDEKMEIDEDNDTSVPPHIIANDVSDDDNENDDDDDMLNSIWDQVPSIPPPPWLDPSDKFRTCE